VILQLLEKICQALNQRDIQYMLSGSLAMNIYTVPRMTRDLDIVIELQQNKVSDFTEIFKENYYIFEEGIPHEIRRQGMFNVIDFETGQKIDFIIRKNSEFHLNEFSRRQKSNLYGFETWVVSKEDLVVSKLKWIQELQSDTQMLDIENLLQIPDIDMEYIIKWVTKLKLNTFKLLPL